MPGTKPKIDFSSGIPLETQLEWRRQLEQERLARALERPSLPLPGPGALPAVLAGAAKIGGQAVMKAGQVAVQGAGQAGRAAARGAQGAARGAARGARGMAERGAKRAVREVGERQLQQAGEEGQGPGMMGGMPGMPAMPGGMPAMPGMPGKGMMAGGLPMSPGAAMVAGAKGLTGLAGGRGVAEVGRGAAADMKAGARGGGGPGGQLGSMAKSLGGSQSAMSTLKSGLGALAGSKDPKKVAAQEFKRKFINKLYISGWTDYTTLSLWALIGYWALSGMSVPYTIPLKAWEKLIIIVMFCVLITILLIMLLSQIIMACVMFTPCLALTGAAAIWQLITGT